MKIVRFIVFAVIFFSAGFFLGQSYQIPPMVSLGGSEQPASFEPIDYLLRYSDADLIEYQNVIITEKSTVLDLLKRLSEENQLNLATQDYENLGTLVIGLGDKKNGDNNKYWQYFVNGQMPQVGAGSFLLSGGEEVEWRFMEFEEENY